MTNQRRPRQNVAPRPNQAATAQVGLEPSKPVIKFRISPPMLRQLLRLAPGVTLVGAGYNPDTGLVEFDVDAPMAPGGAEELVVSYRHTGKPDPIHAQSDWRFPPNGDVA